MKSTWQLFVKTLPFIWMRMFVIALFAIGSVLLLAVLAGIAYLIIRMSGANGMIILLFGVALVGGIFSLYHLLERYVLYWLKAAHIAVILELLDHGQIPEGKSQIEYGKGRIKEMFGATSAFFAMDQLVAASVKQVHRWLIRIGDFLSIIPGAKLLIQFVSMVLSIALNYIDEAIFSRVMGERKENPQSDVWKSSADGIVLNAQCWKGMIGTAAGIAVCSILLSITSLFIVLFPLEFMIHAITGSWAFNTIAFIAALSISFAIKKAFVDPIATIAMIRTYHTKTAAISPNFDLKDQLTRISRKFRNLVSREGSDSIPVQNQGRSAVL